jgi:hypothetical protein
MVVHFLTSVAGLERWSDYIPVKLVQGGPENSYSGTIDVAVIPSLTADTQAWKEYIPVYAEPSATDAWTVNNIGYIPYNYALFNDAAMQLDLTNGAALDPRITFSRTTNATVTGSNGLIQYAPHNLLTFSEQFDNAVWVKVNATVTANTTAAPNGATTADKLVENTFNGQHRLDITPVSPAVPQTFSVYAKAAERNFMGLRIGLLGAAFDLSDGTFGDVSVDSTASITDVGSGWYRCSVTVAAPTANDICRITLATTLSKAQGYTGNGTSGIFIWGAQLELGSTATTYNPTTVKNLLGFTEHFDAAAWTKSNSFVQTNLLTNSEAFDNAAWALDNSGAVNPVVTANAGVAPNGTLTADRIVLDKTGGVFSRIQQSVAATASVVYTFSVYLKTFSGGTSNVGVRLGLVDVNVVVTGEWQRFTVTAAATASAIGSQILLWDVITGNDETADILAWGAQLVQGTSAGDYKATYAAAAAVGYTDIYGQPFAQKLVENTANSAHIITVPAISVPTGSVLTQSYYFKAAERTRVAVRDSSVAATRSVFDLTSGTVVSTGAASTATILDVGDGWYRCTNTYTNSGASSQPFVELVVSGAIISYTGDGTSGIYIFGAQLSDSASVDPYVYQPVAAPASTAYYGPRFDYDPVTLAPKGLLIEEQRTQLLLQSQGFDDAAWVKFSSATVTANTTVAPDGTTTADTINFAISESGIRQGVTTSAGTYTLSVFAKVSSGTKSFRLQRFATTAGLAQSSNFTATTDWQRFTYTVTANSEFTLWYVVNDVAGTLGDLLIWGAQLEAGAFATSYIPSVASQVTRAADNASMIGNNFARWYTQGVGSLYADAVAPNGQVSFGRVLELNGGNSSNRIVINRDAATAYVQISTDSVSQAGFALSGSWANSTTAKVSMAFATNDIAATLNAGTVGTDTSALIPVVGQMLIGAGDGALRSNCTIKRIAYYNRRLANTELTAITS